MRLSWTARGYIMSVVALATIVFLVCVHASSIHAGPVILLALLFALAEWFPVMLPRGAAYSVSFVVSLAAIVTQGPAAAVIAASSGTFNLRGIKRHPAPIASRLFNGSNFIICTGMASLVYRGMGGPIGHQLLNAPGRSVLPVIAATGLNFALNTSLVSLMLALATPKTQFRASPFAIWRTEFAQLLPGYFAFALVGLLLGMLYEQVDAAVMIFALVPLLVARSAFGAAARMQRAYDATIETLITAIEAKDQYTKDHAGRVARLTEMVAREYGIRGERLRTMKLAALMHDIGKLGVPTALLVKPGKLTADEYHEMKYHPAVGHELVKEIEILSDVLDGVRHHHERMDGSGYPDGLRGEEIPLIARIIMVCDAFDSMTSTRAYRAPKAMQSALDELRRCAGTQFDPEALEALHRALAKHGWTAEPEVIGPRRSIDQGSRDAVGL